MLILQASDYCPPSRRTLSSSKKQKEIWSNPFLLPIDLERTLTGRLAGLPANIGWFERVVLCDDSLKEFSKRQDGERLGLYAWRAELRSSIGEMRTPSDAFGNPLLTSVTKSLTLATSITLDSAHKARGSLCFLSACRILYLAARPNSVVNEEYPFVNYRQRL